MANIAKRNDRYTIRFTNFDGTRRQLYGFTNERLAQRIGEKIDDLVVARRVGTIPEELKSWLQKLEPSIHEKLAEWGLCDPPKAKWTLKNLTDSLSVRPTADACSRTSVKNARTVAPGRIGSHRGAGLRDYRDSLPDPQPTDILYPRRLVQYLTSRRLMGREEKRADSIRKDSLPLSKTTQQKSLLSERKEERIVCRLSGGGRYRDSRFPRPGRCRTREWE